MSYLRFLCVYGAPALNYNLTRYPIMVGAPSLGDLHGNPLFFLASPEASNATLVLELIEALDKLPMRTSTPLFFPAKSQGFG